MRLTLGPGPIVESTCQLMSLLLSFLPTDLLGVAKRQREELQLPTAGKFDFQTTQTIEIVVLNCTQSFVPLNAFNCCLSRVAVCRSSAHRVTDAFPRIKRAAIMDCTLQTT